VTYRLDAKLWESGVGTPRTSSKELCSRCYAAIQTPHGRNECESEGKGMTGKAPQPLQGRREEGGYPGYSESTLTARGILTCTYRNRYSSPTKPNPHGWISRQHDQEELVIHRRDGSGGLTRECCVTRFLVVKYCLLNVCCRFTIVPERTVQASATSNNTYPTERAFTPSIDTALVIISHICV
jgi:hypothetical protein